MRVLEGDTLRVAFPRRQHLFRALRRGEFRKQHAIGARAAGELPHAFDREGGRAFSPGAEHRVRSTAQSDEHVLLQVRADEVVDVPSKAPLRLAPAVLNAEASCSQQARGGTAGMRSQGGHSFSITVCSPTKSLRRSRNKLAFFLRSLVCVSCCRSPSQWVCTRVASR